MYMHEHAASEAPFLEDEMIRAKYPFDAHGDSMVTVTVTTQTPQKKCENKRRKVGLNNISARVLTFDQPKQAIVEDSKDQSQVESVGRFDSVLRSQLVIWTDKLLKLQPKVHMSPHIMECGLCLFKSLRQKQLKSWANGKLPKSYISNRDLMIHDLVACWWIAMKHCSVRTAVPNRTLLSRATEAKCKLLAECELSALCALHWDINMILRDHGLVKDF